MAKIKKKAVKRKKRIKLVPISTLKKKLEYIFNRYIRLRDIDDSGWTECISCGKPIEWGTRDCQAGHYVAKTCEPLRFVEENVNAQCDRCNRWLRGNIHNYRKGMVDKYGDLTERLIWGRRHDTGGLSREDLQDKIKYYEKEVETLEQIKGVK